MEIKAVGWNEIGGIKGLWEDLNAHHMSKSTYFKDLFSRFSFEKRFAALSKREGFMIYLAQDNGESIGYCVATVDGAKGEIDSLFVKAEHRGRGVGRNLVTFALKWLEDRKCEIITVSIAEGNEDVLDFYRRFGFAERFVVMQRTPREGSVSNHR